MIPKRIREQFGLSPGQTLQVIALPGRIALVPTQAKIARARDVRFAACDPQQHVTEPPMAAPIRPTRAAADALLCRSPQQR